MNITVPMTLAAASLVLGTRSTSQGLSLLCFIHQGQADSPILQGEKHSEGGELEGRDGAGEVPRHSWGWLDHAVTNKGHRGDASSLLMGCAVILAQLSVMGKSQHRGVPPLNVVGHCMCCCSCCCDGVKPGPVVERRKEKVLEVGEM